MYKTKDFLSLKRNFWYSRKPLCVTWLGTEGEKVTTALGKYVSCKLRQGRESQIPLA